MRYYSNKVFWSFLVINILAILIALLELIWSYGWASSWENLLFNSEGFLFNLFLYIIPLPFAIISTLIILKQQKGHKRAGYFMAILAVFSCIYLIYPEIDWKFWSNINYFFTTQPPLYNFVEFILVLASLIPFYVLGKLIKEDLFKKIAKR